MAHPPSNPLYKDGFTAWITDNHSHHIPHGPIDEDGLTIRTNVASSQPVKFRFRFQRNADLKPISAIAAVYSNGEGTPRLSAVHHLNDDAQESQNKVFKPLETQWFEGAVSTSFMLDISPSASVDAPTIRFRFDFIQSARAPAPNGPKIQSQVGPSNLTDKHDHPVPMDVDAGPVAGPSTLEARPEDDLDAQLEAMLMKRAKARVLRRLKEEEEEEEEK
ncbi:hypothetical protein B0H13DRAFT_2353651 [Mycena leptocephala]|nr:hypothetical protein B0H13DRAFT_2353651 [Mycena leptocephala]